MGFVLREWISCLKSSYQANLKPFNASPSYREKLPPLCTHLVNDNLAAMIKTIYEYWFVQFEFPDRNGKPYKSSGGKMVWNEQLKRTIPQSWAVIWIMNNLLCDLIKPALNFSLKNLLSHS